MNVRQRILIVILTIPLILHLGVTSARASRVLPLYLQEPRPTLPSPPDKPTSTNPPPHISEKPTSTNSPTDIPFTKTPTKTGTPTVTLDLSLNTFLTKTTITENQKKSATPGYIYTPTPKVTRVTQLTTIPVSIQILTPETGDIVPVVQRAIIPGGIFLFFMAVVFAIWRLRSR